MKATLHLPIATDLRRWKTKLATLCPPKSADAKLTTRAKATEHHQPAPRRRTIPFLELP